MRCLDNKLGTSVRKEDTLYQGLGDLDSLCALAEWVLDVWVEMDRSSVSRFHFCTLRTVLYLYVLHCNAAVYATLYRSDISSVACRKVPLLRETLIMSAEVCGN